MSKIYEALRQAELDRSKPGTDESDTGTRAPAAPQTVLEEAPGPTHIPTFSNTGRALATLTPVAKPGAGKAAPAAELKISPAGAAEDDISLSESDLANVPQVAWTPSLVQLPALEERGSAVEQFRSLRSRMQEFRDLNSLKSILVSSGLPQEGKSFVTANLAISFARHKAGRVLLIDGDMRRATLHKLLGCPQGPGLTDFLSGSASIAEVMQRPKASEPGHPMPSGLTSLTFIAAGMEHDKAADLSGSARFSGLIAAAAPYFDWIIVDSSPVNLVSDGVNLARSCDAVLLVARGGVTKYEIAKRAVAELKASKILGFVLNAVKNPPVAGGYYGYDGYDGYDKVEE
jgi:capsular exopolysaccharide synthesis family protein